MLRDHVPRDGDEPPGLTEPVHESRVTGVQNGIELRADIEGGRPRGPNRTAPGEDRRPRVGDDRPTLALKRLGNHHQVPGALTGDFVGVPITNRLFGFLEQPMRSSISPGRGNAGRILEEAAPVRPQGLSRHQAGGGLEAGAGDVGGILPPFQVQGRPGLRRHRPSHGEDVAAAGADRATLPPADEDDPLQRVFRRLDAIREMVRRGEQHKGGCVIGNLSTASATRTMPSGGGWRSASTRWPWSSSRTWTRPRRSIAREGNRTPGACAIRRGHRRRLDHAHPHTARPSNDHAPLRLPQGTPKTVARRSRLVGKGLTAATHHVSVRNIDCLKGQPWRALKDLGRSSPRLQDAVRANGSVAGETHSNGKGESDEASHSLPRGIDGFDRGSTLGQFPRAPPPPRSRMRTARSSWRRRGALHRLPRKGPGRDRGLPRTGGEAHAALMERIMQRPVPTRCTGRSGTRKKARRAQEGCSGEACQDRRKCSSPINRIGCVR